MGKITSLSSKGGLGGWINARLPVLQSFIKDICDVPQNYRSNHMGVSENGFIFESLIPAKYIELFLIHKPKEMIGLVLPGMPFDSLEMEYLDKFSSIKDIEKTLNESDKGKTACPLVRKIIEKLLKKD